jgi:hypothetical protein
MSDKRKETKILGKENAGTDNIDKTTTTMVKAIHKNQNKNKKDHKNDDDYEKPKKKTKTMGGVARMDQDPWEHLGRADYALQRDYLGRAPLFDEKDFQSSFKIPRASYLQLRGHVAALGMEFYESTKPSIDARLLIAVKALVCGVPPFCFRDYISMTQALANECAIQFDKATHQLYQKEFGRLPKSSADIKKFLKAKYNLKIY